MSEIKVAREPASEKVDAAIYFSRSVNNFSDRDSEALFEDAIDFTQEIDRDAFDQIRALDALTKKFSAAERPSTDAISLAANVYTDIAIRLRDQDHFPWSECVRSLTRLSMPTALAAIANWSDQGLQSHTSTLAYMLEELLAEKMEPTTILALRPLARLSSNQFLSDLIDLFSTSSPVHTDSAMAMIAEDCLLYEQPFSIRASAECTLKAIQKSLPSFSNQDTIQKLKQAVEPLSKQPESSEKPTTDEEVPVPAASFDG